MLQHPAGKHCWMIGWALVWGGVGNWSGAGEEPPPDPLAAIVEVSGSVQLLREGESQALTAGAGQLLYSGDRLETGEKGAAVLVLAGGTRHRVGAQQQVTLPLPADATRSHRLVRWARKVWEVLVKKCQNLALHQVPGVPAYPGVRAFPGEDEPLARPVLLQPSRLEDLNHTPILGKSLSHRPLFFWTPVPTATAYSLILFDREDQPLWADRFPIEELHRYNRPQGLLTPGPLSLSLTPGQTYRWQVLAHAPEGFQRSWPAFFLVATEPEVQATEEAISALTPDLPTEKWTPGDHILRALAFESQWLYANALWEYQEAILKQPEDPGLQALFADLYGRTEAVQ